MDVKKFNMIRNFILLTVLVLVNYIEESHSQKTDPCGFESIESSKENPYVIAPISDRLEASSKTDYIWSHALFGNVDRTTASFQPQAKYISASRIGNTNHQYVLYPNEFTKTFTADFGTRVMDRIVNVYCMENLTTPYSYYFRLNFRDLTPPTFTEQFYNYTIAKDWNKDLPISGDRPIIVSDNAYEIRTNPEFITVGSSFSNLLKIKKTALGLSPVEDYTYRLDLFIRKEVELEVGTKRLHVYAKDDQSSSVVNVQINIV